MEKRINFVPGNCPFSRNPNEKIKFKSLSLTLPALAAVVVLAAGPVQASNLLVNPSFETPPSGHAVYGQVVATGWTYFSPPPPANYYGHYWVHNITDDHGVAAHTGTFYWNQWGVLNNGTNNVAGIYQTFSSAPGSTYQASGWFASASLDNGGLGAGCVTWIQVEFLGASSNLLALFKSDNFSASVGLDAWFAYPVTNACDVSSPISTGDPYFTTYAVTGSVNQLVAPVGTTAVRYRYAFLQAGADSTLWKGSADLDDAVLNQTGGLIPPVITNLFPANMIFVNPGDGISFNVSSPSGFTINNSGIRLLVNGVDVSGSLEINGSASDKNVAYHGLQSNLTYTASITVTDASNLTAGASTYFETTWVGIQPVVYLWEAEDFDFANGMYINNPDLCGASGNPNCYFGKVGTEGVDEHNTSLRYGPYRPGDPMGTAPSGDYLRKNLFQAGRLDYCINPFNYSEWVNYTRDWPNGTYWVIARLATDVGLSGTLTLSKVNTNGMTTTDLGTFTIPNGRGWTTFDNVYLKDTNGFLANVNLSNKETLRVTALPAPNSSYPGGNLLPGFFMLVAAQVNFPQLSNLYPTGTHPFEYTNALSFTVTTTGATFPAGGIKVNLDGTDVSASLVINGSASAKNVVYSGLLPNAMHTAFITVTNSLNHGISVTNHFDTFSQDSYMVETEDFDYNGGQYISPWFPESYAGLGATTNIDFQHTPVSPPDEEFTYRTDGIPEDLTKDYLRERFIDVGARDYDLTWFGNGDWANYTRVYPTGNFCVYGRFSGLGSYSIYLDQVLSGAGTTNQVIKRLGHWGTVGRGYNIYDWVPLTDDGLSAPVVVKLNGLGTLRIATAGDNNPNFFMLVPTTGISVSAARSGANIIISFPTQAGVIYRVFYRGELNLGNWTLLTTVLGDGTVKSANDPSTAAKRFYKVVAP